MVVLICLVCPILSELLAPLPLFPQRLPLGEAKWLGTVYHGLPTDQFQPSYERGDYLAFLGRVTADKGPETAIRIARAAGMPLRIAAKLPRAE